MKNKRTKDLSVAEKIAINLITEWCIKALDDVNLSIERVEYDENDESETDNWNSAWREGSSEALRKLENDWGLVIDPNTEIDFSSLWLTFDAKLVTEDGEINITLSCVNHSGDFILSVDGGALRDGYVGVDI